jgi:hypothetical protein
LTKKVFFEMQNDIIAEITARARRLGLDYASYLSPNGETLHSINLPTGENVHRSRYPQALIALLIGFEAGFREASKEVRE